MPEAPDRTLFRLIECQIERTPDAIALLAPARAPLTYEQLFRRMTEVVGALNGLGLGRGDRIALVGAHGPEIAVAGVAIAAGATCLPLNPAYRDQECHRVLTELAARAVIMPSGAVSPARDAAEARGIPVFELTGDVDTALALAGASGSSLGTPADERVAGTEDVALVLPTSGTTARPKRVPLTHANLCASAAHMQEALALTAADRCLDLMPLFHIHGLMAVLTSWAAGASVVCPPAFDARAFFAWLRECRPTWYTSVPTMHQAILAETDRHRGGAADHSLRFIRSCSAALPPRVMAELESMFGAPVVEAYGMTEAAHQIASNPLPPRIRKPGSVGLPAGPAVAVVDEAGASLATGTAGEIVIRGPSVVAGYEDDAAANAVAFRDGWLRTGDQGVLDADGYLFLTGRLKELINRSGEKIAPREIEEVLLEHPDVAEALCFGLPHPTLGEAVAAAVVLREGRSVSERELRRFVASRLAAFKTPQEVVIVPALPRGATGKLRRARMAETLARARSAPPEGRAVAEVADGQLSIARVLRMQAESRPETPAILAPGRIPLAYGPLWRQIEAVVGMLNALGVGRGDRVGVVLPQGPEMAVAVLAVASGATAAPLSPLHREPEYERHLAERKIGTLIVQVGVESAVRTVARARGLRLIELQPLSGAEAGRFTLSVGSTVSAAGPKPAQPDDVAFLLTTSGTTTHTKIVPLTHVNVLAGAAGTVRALELTPADRCLNLMPLFHTHGLAAGLIASLLGGGGVACLPAFDEAQFFRWLEELGPTWYTGVPAMHEAILARAADHAAGLAHHRLRFIRSASVTLPRRVRQQLESVFGVPVTESYGLTEATQLTNTSLSPSLRKPGSVGVAAPGFELAIMDAGGRLLPPGEAGEIVARGPNVMRGYENAPDLNARVFTDGWLRTGDEGFLDAEGYLFLTDRLDDIINRGGEKIAPREVEEVLAAHPAVAQAAVFAVPHPTLGHDVAAAVVLNPGAAQSDERALREFAAASLADFKVPRQIAIVDRLPATPIGKVSRRRVGESLGLVASKTDAGGGDPRTAVESALAEICRGVLRLDVVRVEDNLFALGADSISATRILAQVRDALGVELPLLRFFEAPTVADLTAAVEEARGAPAEPIPSLTPIRRTGVLPLSFAQQRLWFLDQLDPGTATYNVVVAYRLSGELDAAALEASLREVVRRHAALRTAFPSTDGRPVQVILPSVDFWLSLEDLEGWPEAEREGRALALATAEARRPFDLARGPLFRAKLFRLGREAHVLVIGMHHVVSDGWSRSVLANELTALYAAFAAGRSSPLPALPVQYADYAVWQRQWLDGGELERQLTYWKGRLGGTLPVLELPADRPRPAVQTSRGATVSRRLPAELTRALHALSRSEGATLFMTLLAAFKTLLLRYTGQEDVLVGTATAGRAGTELEGLIGFFVNTLVLRSDLSGDPTFRELLARVREVALGAYVHPDLPFEKLVDELQPERQANRTPVFQVMFVLQNAPASTPTLPGLTVRRLELDPGVAKFDLTCELREEDDQLRVELTYNTDLFDPGTIARLLGHWETLLEGIVADPGCPITRIPLMPAPESAQLAAWGRARERYPRTVTVNQLFEAQAAERPTAVAVVCDDRRLTYGELNRRANRLAHQLRDLGVGPDVLVGLCADRSVELVVGVLAILKAGGAYVPLDPSYPPDRLAFMVEDAQAPVVVAQASVAGALPDRPGTTTVVLERFEAATADAWPDHDPMPLATPDHLAYVIYTSGSTGSPKGVLVTHYNVVRLLRATEARYGFAHTDVWTLFHSYAFDFSVWELWGALAYGGRLVVVPHWASRSPGAVVALLRRERVTVLNQTPSAFRQLVQAEAASGDAGDLTLRLVIFGGEALDLQSLRPWFARHGDRRPQLVNMYGITETTVHVTYRPLTMADVDAGSGSVIGGPIPDLSLRVLDPQRQPVPIGVPGELYVGGAGVTRGYHRRPELTAERFVGDPWDAGFGARLYRSGDLARYLPNGDLEYLGRIDHQVKIRGFRIELGEIESTLSQHPAVREVAVVAREDSPGDRRLVAYLVGDGAIAGLVDDLRSVLRAKLPEYMVPAHLVLLDKLPLTAHGKVDRRALPALDEARAERGSTYVAPADDTEATIAGIWREVLRVDRVGRDDNFFLEFGGHSLMAIQLLARLREAFQIDLSLRCVFDAPTVAGLADMVRACQRDAAAE